MREHNFFHIRHSQLQLHTDACSNDELRRVICQRLGTQQSLCTFIEDQLADAVATLVFRHIAAAVAHRQLDNLNIVALRFG